MALNRPAVSGPDFARIVADASDKVQRLEASNWDFDSVPEVFARDQHADVIGKEAVHMFDGRTMTRVGRLVLGGVGEHFNLMGTFPADSTFRVATEYTSSILDEIHRQAGSRRLSERPEHSGMQ